MKHYNDWLRLNEAVPTNPFQRVKANLGNWWQGKPWVNWQDEAEREAAEAQQKNQQTQMSRLDDPAVKQQRYQTLFQAFKNELSTYAQIQGNAKTTAERSLSNIAKAITHGFQ